MGEEQESDEVEGEAWANGVSMCSTLTELKRQPKGKEL
jgi:hypothetical protein